MATATPGDWDRFRAYLNVLARQQVPRADRARIDPSGVVQGTLLEAYRDGAGLETLPGPARLAWLRKALARNLADEYRRQYAERRDVRRERRLAAGVETSADGLGNWLAAADSSPSERADRTDQLLRLTAALADLPEAQREAVEMHYFQRRPVADVASDLGRSVAAVAGLLKRGLQSLRAALRDPHESTP